MTQIVLMESRAFPALVFAFSHAPHGALYLAHPKGCEPYYMVRNGITEETEAQAVAILDWRVANRWFRLELETFPSLPDSCFLRSIRHLEVWVLSTCLVTMCTLQSTGSDKDVK